MKQVTKHIDGKVYHFYGRYRTKEIAREVVKELLQQDKHAYYIKVQSNKVQYWDVRLEN